MAWEAGQEQGSEFSLAETPWGEKSGKGIHSNPGEAGGARRCQSGVVGLRRARENREGTGESQQGKPQRSRAEQERIWGEPGQPKGSRSDPRVAEENHRMSQVGREHSDSSGPTSLLKHAYLRARFTGLHPDVSGILPVRKMAHPLWAVFQCMITRTVKKLFLIFQCNCLCIIFCPLALVLSLGTPSTAWSIL